MNIGLHRGDCLEVMAGLPDGCVDLVLTDPPYGTMSTIARTSLAGRMDWDVALDPREIFRHLNRILRPNGTVALFSQEPYTTRLISNAHGSIPFAYRMTWLKDSYGNPLNAKKAPLVYTEDVLVFVKNFDSFVGHPLKPWMDSELEAAGMTRKQAVERWGTSAAHYFTDGRQFMTPTQERLAQMHADTGRFAMAYEDMQRQSRAFREETRAKFPKVFNLRNGERHKSNVLRYKKDAAKLHPTQKPVPLLVDLIETFSNPGNTVLDFTMGSGSTGEACAKTGRRFIGIERDPDYFEIARQRILAAMPGAANDGQAEDQAAA